MFVVVMHILVIFFAFISCAEQPLNFAVIGDYGVDNLDEKNVADLVKRNNPEFIITVGDNNYPNGCSDTIDKNIGKYYHDYILNYSGSYGPGASIQRFYPTLGNHDWYAKITCPQLNGMLPYINYFSLPNNERYYDFVKGPVHFFALDSDVNEPHGYKINSKQYKWLKDRVRKSKAEFKIAYFHHSPYSSGPHGDNKSLQWDFDALGIDVVITGHDHIYERIHKKGVIYIVNGLGGAAPYDKVVDRKPNSFDRDSKKFYAEKHGALFVTAENSTLTIRFINFENTEIDGVSVIKKTTRSARLTH